MCDVAKTREQILNWYKQFNNLNVLVQRDPEKKYVRSGRLQDEEDARRIDAELRGVLKREGIKYTELPPDHRAIIAFAAELE